MKLIHMLRVKNPTIQAVIFFLLFFGFAGAIFFSWYLGQSSQEFAQHKTQNFNLLKIHEHQLSTEYESVIADLSILSSLPKMDFDQQVNPEVIKELQQFYSSFARARKRYHQIRYLDDTGKERIRINYDKGQIQIVPAAELQNKSHRYYVQDILKLPSGDIYVSPFDLNIENRVVEEPYRPMIRLGKHLFENGKPVGMIIINYEGKFLFQAISKERSIMTNPAQLMILNQDGYWLKSNDSEEEWGFMFSHKKQQTFAKQHPDVWKYIQTHYSGQYQNQNGLYSFLKISPLNPISSIHSSLTNHKELITKQGHENAAWILVNYLPKSEFNRQTVETIKQNAMYIIITLIATFLVALLVSRYQLERHTLMQRNEYLANHDPLTGLLNRTVLDYALPKKLHRAQKSRNNCTLYYIDLDGFKPVNDTYGHDIGDELLKVVARRLVGATRSHDDLIIRMGGDELLVAVCGLNNEEEQVQFGNKLLKIFKSPMVVKKHTLKIGATIGAATYPVHSEDLDQLISMADDALYSAKQTHKGQLSMYPFPYQADSKK